MNKKFNSVLLIAVLLFTFCGPSDEDKARVKMNQVLTLLQQNDTVNALIHLDSFAVLYPKAAYSVNAAKNLKTEILWKIYRNKQVELDSAVSLISKLEANFDKVKTDYDLYQQYVHKLQKYDRTWNRSFIQVNLDERGEISLTSNYFGSQWLNHRQIRIYDKELQATTQEVSENDVDNYRSNFMETKWERVTYRNGKENGIVKLIAENPRRMLKAQFMGKSNYYIVLDEADKKAVRDALLLSAAIIRKTAIEKEMKMLQIKLDIR